MVINILFALLCLVCPLLAILSYRQGVRDGRAIRHDVPLSPMAPVIPSKPKPKSIDEINAEISLANMINYDGTPDSQIDLAKEVRR